MREDRDQGNSNRRDGGAESWRTIILPLLAAAGLWGLLFYPWIRTGIGFWPGMTIASGALATWAAVIERSRLGARLHWRLGSPGGRAGIGGGALRPLLGGDLLALALAVAGNHLACPLGRHDLRGRTGLILSPGTRGAPPSCSTGGAREPFAARTARSSGRQPGRAHQTACNPAGPSSVLEVSSPEPT